MKYNHSHHKVNKNRQPNDYYPTPIRALDLLYDRIGSTLPNTIYEPMCGMNHISNYLNKKGHSVISTDITTGDDVLIRTELFNSVIVSNPPYKNAVKFVEKLTSLTEHDVILLLPLGFAAAKSRVKAMNELCTKMYVIPERLVIESGGELVTSHFNHVWFVFNNNKTGVTEFNLL